MYGTDKNTGNSKIFLELAQTVGNLREGTIATGLLKTSNLANLVIFWKNMVKFLVTYVTKCIADVILKTILVKHKIVIFQTHLPTLVLTSNKI